MPAGEGKTEPGRRLSKHRCARGTGQRVLLLTQPREKTHRGESLSRVRTRHLVGARQCPQQHRGAWGCGHPWACGSREASLEAPSWLWSLHCQAHAMLNRCQRAVRSPVTEHKGRLCLETDVGPVTAVAAEKPLTGSRGFSRARSCTQGSKTNWESIVSKLERGGLGSLKWPLGTVRPVVEISYGVE